MIKKKTIIYFGLMLSFGLMLGFTVCTFAQVEPKRVSSAELKEKIEKKRDLLIVDVRSKAKYLVGHIPTAISIPFGEVAARHKELPKDQHIVFY